MNIHTTQFQVVCDLFAAQHPELATPTGAADKCGWASARFLDLCIEHKLISPTGNQTGEWGNEETKIVNGVSHRVARINGTFIDWTACQYNPDAEWPLITTQNEEDL